MPLPVAKIRWKCSQCGKSRWLKPNRARRRRFCSRACLHQSLRVEDPVRAVQSARQTFGERNCDHCGLAYNAKSAHQRFCSQLCCTRAVHVRNRRGDVVERPCEGCGKVFRPRPGNAGRFCSRPCLYKVSRGDRAGHWRGGRHVTPSGYIRVWAPEHPGAMGRGGYVPEHRLVMEQKLGRRLERGESVHHIDGDRANNAPENLQLRRGKHGRGAAHRCRDCGSMNIEAVPIQEPAHGGTD